ncbi:hypothetical protein BpHYR1_027026 [Brachionus plicatilis]|uniref:Uncharacterized protein n=1 Tax=Brachionus plicatilis TaxID=10195 RepID=A0A3M7QWQ6_BRAPC|nr:hypothetical protein BpHYR1_027026 [Brachionus plicatilis]
MNDHTKNIKFFGINYDLNVILIQLLRRNKTERFGKLFKQNESYNDLTCEEKIDCLQGKKNTKPGRKYRDKLDEIVTIGPSVSVDTLGLQNGLSSSQSQLQLNKRVLLLVLINKEFDFSCKIKEDMLLTMPEDVPYGALNVDFKNVLKIKCYIAKKKFIRIRLLGIENPEKKIRILGT